MVSKMLPLQYIKGADLENNDKDMMVTTSGAGGLFKSGILIGKIDSTEKQI
jgi:cell shape-determining protein MreC